MNEGSAHWTVRQWYGVGGAVTSRDVLFVVLVAAARRPSVWERLWRKVAEFWGKAAA